MADQNIPTQPHTTRPSLSDPTVRSQPGVARPRVLIYKMGCGIVISATLLQAAWRIASAVSISASAGLRDAECLGGNGVSLRHGALTLQLGSEGDLSHLTSHSPRGWSRATSSATSQICH